MQIGYLKGCKPKFIKQIVLLVGLFYLLNPLQNQIISILHTISHSIEMPVTLLDHSEENEKITATHKQHDHNELFSEHTHQFLDFVISIFEASNDDSDSDETIVNKIKVKKHIASSLIKLPLNYERNKVDKYFTPIARLKKGHPKKLEFPPIHRLS